MDGFFPAEFKKQYPEGIRFVVEDHCKAFKGQPHSLEKQTDLEMLQPPNEIGIGEGELKLKIPGLSDVTIKIGKEMTIGEVMELVEFNFDLPKFKIGSPMVPGGYDSDVKLVEVELYPRGFGFVVFT
jgi:hypothetical protein